MKAFYRTAFEASHISPFSFSTPLLKGQKIRWQSTSTAIGISNAPDASTEKKTSLTSAATSPLTRLTTWHLMRNIILGSVLTRPFLYKPALAAVQKVANSSSPFLNPDRNPILRALIKPVLYNHFCAGTNKTEIEHTIDQVRKLGFAGVVLCYGREIQLSSDNQAQGSQDSRDAQFLAWQSGTLETLDMADAGNWLGIKFTGAGQDVTDALIKEEVWSPSFEKAIYAICDKAKARKCRIWIDSEQSAVQGGIDQWTINLMRKYNRNGEVLVYNTIQGYLKNSREKLRKQLTSASEEGWTLAIKLVRGAYIANDNRSLIHDTKAETDASYDGIVKDLLQGTFDGFTKNNFPFMRLLLAGHNSETVEKALELGYRLASNGQLKVNPEFAQLQGMADDVGCKIIHFQEQIALPNVDTMQTKDTAVGPFLPQVFKCLTWGSIQECINYLIRRAVENSAAVDRMRATASASKEELIRRITPKVLRKS